jgi:hypothetical protein
MFLGTDNLVAEDSHGNPVDTQEMLRTIRQDLYNKLEDPPDDFLFFFKAEDEGVVNIVVQHIRDCSKSGELSRRNTIVLRDIPILGILRAGEVADVIVDYLDIEADYPGSIRWPEYPAMDALGKIGSPATPHILKAITDKDHSDVFYENAATVLKHIYGAKIARIVVNDALNDETDAAKKARLEKLLQSFPAGAESAAPTEETPAPAPRPEAHPSPATHAQSATAPTEEAAPPAQTVSTPAPAFPWYAAGLIGLVLGAAATFALTRAKK